MPILTCHIAGIPHRKPSSLPEVGTMLRLEPEPTNAFDPNAIKIIWDVVPEPDLHIIFLGYVPKEETATVRAFGLTKMKVVEVKPERKWKEVIVESVEEPK